MPGSMGIEQTIGVPAVSGPIQTNSSENTVPSSGGHEFANGEPTTPRAPRPAAPDQPHQSTPFAARATNALNGSRESSDSATVNNNNEIAPDNRRSSHRVAGGSGQNEEIGQDNKQIVINTVPSALGLGVPFSKILQDYKVTLEDVDALTQGPQKCAVTIRSVLALIKRMSTLASTVQVVIGRGEIRKLDRMVEGLEEFSTDLGEFWKIVRRSDKEVGEQTMKSIATQLSDYAHGLSDLGLELPGYLETIKSGWIESDKKIRCLQLIGIALAVAGAALAAVAVTGLLVFAPPVGIAAGAAVAAIGAALLIASYRAEGRIADKREALKLLSPHIDTALIGEWPEAIFYKRVSVPRSDKFAKYHQVMDKYKNRQILNRDDIFTLNGEFLILKNSDPYFANAFIVLTNANFHAADLRGMNFREIDFTNANFTAANLEGASFKDVTMAFANLSEANLQGASLVDVVCNGVKLTEANMTNVNMDKVDLGRAMLEGADVAGALFMQVNFDLQSFYYVTSQTAQLKSCLLNGGLAPKSPNIRSRLGW